MYFKRIPLFPTLVSLLLAGPAAAESWKAIDFNTATAQVQQGLLEQGPNPGHPAPFVWRNGDPGMDHLVQTYTFYNNGPARPVEARLIWTETNCEFEIGLALYAGSFNPADPRQNLIAHSFEGPFHSHNGHQYNDYRHSPGFYRDLFQRYFLDYINAKADAQAYETIVVVLNSRRQPGGPVQNCPTNPNTAAQLYLITEGLAEGSPSISISDSSDYEYGPLANQGAMMSFYVSLDTPIEAPVSVQVSTADGLGMNAAQAGIDYVASNQLVTFEPGQTFKVVQVPVIGDAAPEPNRSFRLLLSSPNPATLQLGDAEAAGTIIDDDDLAGTCHIVSPGSLPSGRVGEAYGPIVFDPDGAESTDPYAWEVVSGATPPGIPLTTTVHPVTLETLGQLAGTPTQAGTYSFTLRLTCPQLDGGSIEKDTAFSLLIEPELPPVIFNLADVVVTEGDAGTTPAPLLLTLSAPLTSDTLFEVRVLDNSATTADADYTAVPPGQLILVNAGITELNVPMEVVGDLDVEDDETFLVELRTQTAGEFVASGTVTIVNDDINASPRQDQPIPASNRLGILLLAALILATVARRRAGEA